MKAKKAKKALNLSAAYLLIMLLFTCSAIFAQRIDSTKIYLKPRAKTTSKFPVIRGNVQSYQPHTYNSVVPSTSTVPSNTVANVNGKERHDKTLTVLKIYPNPVLEQLNINLRLEKENNLSIKITDLLGNEVVTLANEKAAAGEHTKTYAIPAKLNAGMYFLRIVAGGEPVIKRISVL